MMFKLSDWIAVGESTVTVGQREYLVETVEIAKDSEQLYYRPPIWTLTMKLAEVATCQKPFARPTRRSHTALGLRKP
jgi:hypothetical protein